MTRRRNEDGKNGPEAVIMLSLTVINVEGCAKCHREYIFRGAYNLSVRCTAAINKELVSGEKYHTASFKIGNFSVN